jgi:hypothetical protein
LYLFSDTMVVVMSNKGKWMHIFMVVMIVMVVLCMVLTMFR